MPALAHSCEMKEGRSFREMPKNKTLTIKKEGEIKRNREGGWGENFPKRIGRKLRNLRSFFFLLSSLLGRGNTFESSGTLSRYREKNSTTTTCLYVCVCVCCILIIPTTPNSSSSSFCFVSIL
jgi:hypothetical protein